jgi:hypothetical protein
MIEGTVSLRRRVRNEKLRALVNEARWTNHNFAKAVNRVAAETGTTLHYDRTTVSHWLSGSRPRGPMTAFVTEALTRRLGRLISVADTGLGDHPSSVPLLPAEEDHAVGTLLQLVAADLDPARRTALQELPYRVDWATNLDLPSVDRGIQPSTAVPLRVGPGAIEAIRAMTDAFASADKAFGGGHARIALVTYLATDIAGWLRAEATTPVRRELLRAAATLTYLSGFMCFDNLHHNLAQRYFRAALQLVTEANAPTVHAIVLRGMSMQARFLGHYRQAAQLAEAAVDRAGSVAPAETRASLLGQAAVAHAALANRQTAMSYLAKAERQLSQAEGTSGPVTCGSRADLAHETGQVLTWFHDHGGAEVALRESLEHRATVDRRSRLITTHHLAQLQLRRDRPELACTTWQLFMTECTEVNSARLRRAVDTLREQLLPYKCSAVVRRTLDQAIQLSGR